MLTLLYTILTILYTILTLLYTILTLLYTILTLLYYADCSPVTAVDICYEGNYHFLHDLTCKQSRTHLHTATKYRQILVDRFWKSIERLVCAS